MLAVWRAADGIEVFESGWTSDHFYPMHGAGPRPAPGGLDHAGRARAGDPAAAAGHAGHRHSLPASRGAGQHGGHARRRVRRAPGTRHRDRLEPGGVRRLRHRAGHAPAAQRPVRGGLPRACRAALAAAGHHVHRPLLPADRRPVQPQAGAAAAPSDLHRRPRRAAHAAHRGPFRPALELRRRDTRPVRPGQGRAAPALRGYRPRSGGASCCPARCRSPATRPRRPPLPPRSARRVPGWRSSRCGRRTRRRCWSRWRARCRSWPEPPGRRALRPGRR